MGTRATYSFDDGDQIFHVYKHWDGYPEGAVEFIEAALKSSWKLPQFEADEFAASFVAANKTGQGGDIRLLQSGHWREISPDDIEYRYLVTCKNGEIHIITYSLGEDWQEIFSGTLDEMNEEFRPEK